MIFRAMSRSDQAAYVRAATSTAAAFSAGENFGAYTLRSGFVTEADRSTDTMAMTGHRSVQTVMRCIQTGAIGQTRAKPLMCNDVPNDGVPSIL